MDNINPKWVDMYKNDYYSRERIIRAVSMVRDRILPGDVVIDLGAFQQFVKELLPSCCNYLPYDSYSYKDNQVLDLDLPIELPKSRFVFCLETLEHLKNPKMLLNSASKCLSEDGFLVVSLPNEATIFHRVRSLLGTPDAECFSYPGKHLHLPSLKQCRTLLQESHLHVLDELYYICPTAVGSRSKILKHILPLIPEKVHYFLASLRPSLFARGFIFLCRANSKGSS